MGKKGFSLVEFLVSLVILTLVGIALFNSIVFFIHKKLITTLDSHIPDAAKNLITVPEKLKNCKNVQACDAFSDSSCTSSISCAENYCTNSSKCVICYTNPDNGRKLFYSFNASLINNGTDVDTYSVTICWKYGGQNNTKTLLISIPK